MEFRGPVVLRRTRCSLDHSNQHCNGKDRSSGSLAFTKLNPLHSDCWFRRCLILQWPYTGRFSSATYSSMRKRSNASTMATLRFY
jgi:hypothetical protein